MRNKNQQLFRLLGITLILLLLTLNLAACGEAEYFEAEVYELDLGTVEIEEGEAADPGVNDEVFSTQYSLKTEMAGQQFVVTKDTGLGLIHLDPPGGSYAPGTVVTVTAKPSMLSTFDGWSGDLSGATNPTTITMDSNKSITASFSRPSIGENKVALDYFIDGPGSGNVTLDPPGGIYDYGTSVTFTAQAFGDSVFSHWGGGNVDHPVYGTDPSKTFHLIDSSTFVVAYFDTQESVKAFNAQGNINEHQRPLPWMGSEVFVRFDQLDAFMAFNAPGLNTMLMPHETDKKLIAQWNGMVETHDHDTSEEGFETTADGGNIYTRIWIESKNEARIVVRYRSAPVNFSNQLAHTQLGQVAPYGPGDHVDEWFTIYPDGTYTREVKVWSPIAADAVPYTDDRIETYFFETQEFLFNNMGMEGERYLSDDLFTDALNLVKMDGTHQVFSFDPYPVNQFEWEDLRSAFEPFEHANMVILNTKSPLRPYTIGREHPTDNWVSVYPNEASPNEPHHIFNEWPVEDILGEGYIGGGLAHIVVAGDKNSWFRQDDSSVTKIYLSGYVEHTTDSGNADYVKDVGRSWLTAAELTETSSTPAEVYGYDMPQKAYLVDYAGVANTSAVTFNLNASSTSPMVNPAILINNWGSAFPSVEIDNVPLAPGEDFKYGYYSTLDVKDSRTWQDVLIIWIKQSSKSPVTIKIDPAPLQFLPTINSGTIQNSP